MENTKYGKRREGRWTPVRAKAQDTRANPNSWETHLVRKRWYIGLLRALNLRIMMVILIIYSQLSTWSLLLDLSTLRFLSESAIAARLIGCLNLTFLRNLLLWLTVAQRISYRVTAPASCCHIDCASFYNYE